MLFWSVTGAPASASVTFSVLFDASAAGLSPALRSDVEANLLGAGALWSQQLSATAALDVRVLINNGIPRATGRSTDSSFVRNNGLFNVFEQGAGAEVRTGLDPNGSTHDIEITLSTNYLLNELWLDPQPFSRSAQVPANRTDAVSVFLHELGHALAFNGWNNGFDDYFPGDYQSTFDEWLVFDGEVLTFTGPSASQVYGRPLPTTRGNPSHLGNVAPLPGDDLIPDMMNGVVYQRGYRYDISAIDLAVLADVGLPVVGPPVLVGDANGDCQVGAADYALWAAQWGQVGNALTADFDNSGSVGAGDYALWAANFGNTCGPSALDAQLVPEASSAVLALTALLLGAWSVVAQALGRHRPR